MCLPFLQVNLFASLRLCVCVCIVLPCCCASVCVCASFVVPCLCVFMCVGTHVGGVVRSTPGWWMDRLLTWHHHIDTHPAYHTTSQRSMAGLCLPLARWIYLMCLFKPLLFGRLLPLYLLLPPAVSSWPAFCLHSTVCGRYTVCVCACVRVSCVWVMAALWWHYASLIHAIRPSVCLST